MYPVTTSSRTWPSLKPTWLIWLKAPENGWLEDEISFLGTQLFSGVRSVSFRECNLLVAKNHLFLIGILYTNQGYSIQRLGVVYQIGWRRPWCCWETSSLQAEYQPFQATWKAGSVLLMEEIRLTSWYGKSPVMYRGFYIPGGAGFLPSTVFLRELVCWFGALGWKSGGVPKRVSQSFDLHSWWRCFSFKRFLIF